MEIAKINVGGTIARVKHRNLIPAGLVGGYITVEYSDPLWDRLTKTVVFKGSQTKVVVTNDCSVKIPSEAVAAQGDWLQVGFYGTESEGILAIPTLWADLGVIQPAASPGGDQSADPSLPVYTQLAQRIDHLEDQLENLEFGGSGGTVLFLDPEVGEVFTGTIKEPDISAPVLTGISAAYSGGDVLIGTALSALVGIVVTAAYSDGTTKTVTDYRLSGEIAEGSNTITVTYEGMTATFAVTGVAEEPEVTLSSISATYTGGSVAVGTVISNLTGVTVMAHYSDGSTAPVTGYTLSGEIAEGSNTITVSYGGMTTTFEVTGEAEETLGVKIFEPVVFVEDGFLNVPIKRMTIAYNSSWSSETHAMYKITLSSYAAISGVTDAVIDGMDTVLWNDRENYDEVCAYYNPTTIWIRVPVSKLADTTTDALINYLSSVNKDVIKFKYNDGCSVVSIDESATFSSYSEITYDTQMENTVCFKVLTSITGYSSTGSTLCNYGFKMLGSTEYTVLQSENAVKLNSDGYLEMLLEPGVIPESSLEAVKAFLRANPITLYNITSG